MKRISGRIISLLLAMLFIPILSHGLSALEADAVLKALDYDITILKDGSAQITETREVSFTGDHEFSQYGFGYRFTQPQELDAWEITMDGEELALLDEPDDNGRPENTFAIVKEDGKLTVSIYHRSREVTRTFTISYRMKNAVKLYSDVGDFGWDLTGKDGISDIGLVTATLTVPQGISKEEFRIWAHGPLNGKSEKRSSTEAYFEIEDVPRGELVDIRAVMPSGIFTGGWRQEGEALSEILAKEKELADIANAKREEEARERAEREAAQAAKYAWIEEHPVLASIQSRCEDIYYFFSFEIEDNLGILTAAASFAVLVVSIVFGDDKKSKKFRREPSIAPEYYRELPDDRPAPVVDRLLHFYSGDGRADTSRQIAAALLELNLKKAIRFEVGSKDPTIILDKSSGQKLFAAHPHEAQSDQKPNRAHSVKLIRKGDEVIVESDSAVGEHHRPTYTEALWDYLLGAVGDDGRISVKELKKYAKQNQDSAYGFRRGFEAAVNDEYDKWVKTEARKGLGLRECRWLFITPIVVGSIGMLVRMGFSLYSGIDYAASIKVGLITLAITALLAAVYFLGKKFSGSRYIILSQKSEDDLALWSAFGRFLDDFTTFDRKELPEFPVWREFMVYAVAMGKGKKLVEALAVRYPESLGSEENSFDEELRRFLRDSALYSAIESIGQDVVSASPSQSSSSSSSGSYSSSDGSGGGFSASSGGSGTGSTGDFAD